MKDDQTFDKNESVIGINKNLSGLKVTKHLVKIESPSSIEEGQVVEGNLALVKGSPIGNSRSSSGSRMIGYLTKEGQ